MIRPVLREAIAARYGLAQDRIVCGAGSDELLHLLAQAYLGEGDEAISTEHGFLVYPIVTKAAGATSIIVKEKELRTDVDAILASVAKTHRVVLVDESKPFGGVSAMVSHLIQEHAFDELDAPIKRVCTIDAPAIYSPHIENEQLPNPKRIVEKVLTIA